MTAFLFGTNLQFLLLINLILHTKSQFINSTNYIVVQQAKNYADANSYCNSQFSTSLASIHSASQNSELGGLCRNNRDTVCTAYRCDSCWIGLERGSSQGWIWEDGTTYNYNNWGDGEPNNSGGIENCTQILTIGTKVATGADAEKWSDIPCDLPRYFVCNRYNPSSTNYYRVPILQEWNAANSICQSLYGTDLASIVDASQNAEANGLCGEQDCWIGLNDRDSERFSSPTGWIWVDDTVFSYSNWGDREPNNAGNEDCVAMRSTAQWNDFPCVDFTREFLCNRYNPTVAPTTAAPTTSAPTTAAPTSAAPTTAAPTTAVPTTAVPTSASPTAMPSLSPTEKPTQEPSKTPTEIPTNEPTKTPTEQPSENPTSNPTSVPTLSPTGNPSADPTIDPTQDPTDVPSSMPTIEPTTMPTTVPTTYPTTQPTLYPTLYPTQIPSVDPTAQPTSDPTIEPTVEPTVQPTTNPTMEPTLNPTFLPTNNPTGDPTLEPTVVPSAYPTQYPTLYPTAIPTVNPSKNPTTNPTNYPTLLPSVNPTNVPTLSPSVNPTFNPTEFPSVTPSNVPTTNPSVSPTRNPIVGTRDPSTNPTANPTFYPIVTSNPTMYSTATMEPSNAPTSVTSDTNSTANPTSYPTASSFNATSFYTSTFNPTMYPSEIPSKIPSNSPSESSTSNPSSYPTVFPSISSTTPSPIIGINEPTQSPQSNDADSSIGGVIDGIVSDQYFLVLVIMVAIAICLILLFIIWCCRRKRNQSKELLGAVQVAVVSPGPTKDGDAEDEGIELGQAAPMTAVPTMSPNDVTPNGDDDDDAESKSGDVQQLNAEEMMKVLSEDEDDEIAKQETAGYDDYDL